MAERARIGNRAGKIVVWILLALLIVGLAGFGIGSFGGSATAIGTVGDRQITAESYFRVLSRTLRAQRAETGQAITRSQAEASGLLSQVQGQLAAQAALDGEAEEIGLSVSDEIVGEQILSEQAFQGPDGTFDRETYEFTLQQNGWTVPQYEEEVRRELTRALLQGAVAGGMATPEALAAAVLDYVGERRTLAWRRFGPEDLAEPLPEPSDAELRAQYEATPEAYTLPESKRITYAIVTPEDVADTMAPEPEAIRELYEERIDEYVQPERRLVERLVFESEAAAQQAAERIEAGETTFAETVEARDLTLSDVDMGDVSRAELGAAAEEIFSREEPGVVGPLPSPFGPALYQVNAILDAREVPLAEVRDDLAAELARARAQRTLDDLATEFDDRLAAGATLEDLAEETEMRLGTVDYFPGIDTDEGGPIVGYPGFRAAAEAVSAEDFPRIETLEDGSLFALRLDETVPARQQPLEAVRTEVAEDWRAAETVRRLRERAEAALADLSGGRELGAGETAEDVRVAEGVTRDARLEDVPRALVTRAFAMETGERAIVEGSDAVYLMELRDVAPPDPEEQNVAALRQAVAAQAAQGLASDILQYYGQALIAQAGVRFDQAALNAVHSQVFN